MSTSRKKPIVVADGDVSDKWRALWVEVESPEGWAPRTDLWPLGITVKPGVDPADIRKQVAEELSYPEATLLDGSTVEAITWTPEEVRLLDYGV